ncbi:MAG: type II secretion system F family protein [Geminicoccaceae bacterium]
MFSLVESLVEPQVLITILVAISVFASVITLTMPLMSSDKLKSRLKHVSTEREVLRARHRAMLEQEKSQTKLRQANTGYMQQAVKQLNLSRLLETKDTRDRLKMAGLRAQKHVVTFLFFRAVMPFVFATATFVYLYITDGLGMPPFLRLVIVLFGAYLGFYLPNIFIANMIAKRQKSIKRAFPDALDLLLICVESGMSIEAAFNKVAEEIGSQSIELAEEMSLTTAELSYLQERRQAYDNLGKRTGLPGVKGVVTSLIQAERYGTPVGQALRVLAQENRDMRMSEAEKMAAGLPPKLTVPMVLFFLPVIFVIILGPSGIQISGIL